MLTRIEMQYMNAVIGIHDEIKKANERGVDWEQRRYEIAKEMLPYVAETTRSILASGHGLGDEAEGKTVPEVCGCKPSTVGASVTRSIQFLQRYFKKEL